MRRPAPRPGGDRAQAIGPGQACNFIFDVAAAWRPGHRRCPPALGAGGGPGPCSAVGIGARTTGPAAAGRGWPAGACVLLPRPLGAGSGGWRAALRRCGGRRRSADAAGRRRSAGHWPCFAAGAGAPLQLGTGAGKRKAATAAVEAVARRHRHGSCSHGQKTQLVASASFPCRSFRAAPSREGDRLEERAGGRGAGKPGGGARERGSEGATERGSRGESARHRARIRWRAGRPLSAGSGPGLRRIRPGLRRAHRTGTPGHPGRSEGARERDARPGSGGERADRSPPDPPARAPARASDRFGRRAVRAGPSRPSSPPGGATVPSPPGGGGGGGGYPGQNEARRGSPPA